MGLFQSNCCFAQERSSHANPENRVYLALRKNTSPDRLSLPSPDSNGFLQLKPIRVKPRHQALFDYFRQKQKQTNNDNQSGPI